MTKGRILIGVVALICGVLGALFGALMAPGPSRYIASAHVALLPSPDLSLEAASNFWEVLTRGQVTRTVAIVYDDPRWLGPAANAAGVPESELTLDASAVPETTMLTVTVSAKSATAAETALNNVLTTVTPEAGALAQPYFLKVLWPPKGSGYPDPTPGRTQVAAAGALGGLLVGIGIGWLVARRRSGHHTPEDHPGDDDRADAGDGAGIRPRA